MDPAATPAVPNPTPANMNGVATILATPTATLATIPAIAKNVREC